MFRSFGKLFFILAAAAVFAMPAARADDQVKIGLLFDVTPHDLLTKISAAAVLIGVAFVAAYVEIYGTA